MIKKGFTMVELVVIIGLIALIAVIVVLVLNPAKIFQEARDSQRISDLGHLNNVLSLYSITVPGADLDGVFGGSCAVHCWIFPPAGPRLVASSCDFRYDNKTPFSLASRAVNGTGWVPVNLTTILGGSPLPAYPIDPVNTISSDTQTSYFYSYGCNSVSNTFELNANMESVRYKNGGVNDVESTDGGSLNDVYEVGTDPGLDL